MHYVEERYRRLSSIIDSDLIKYFVVVLAVACSLTYYGEPDRCKNDLYDRLVPELGHCYGIKDGKGNQKGEVNTHEWIRR